MDTNKSIKVYSKNMELLATFNNDADGISPESAMNLMVCPTVRLESGQISTFSFQMLAKSEKWQHIKNPENIYVVDNRYYTPMTNDSYFYEPQNGVSVVNVRCLERQSLLSEEYHQVYNCGIYAYAKAKFVRYTNEGAEFTISSSGCSNPGNTISNENSWLQVKNWVPKDDDGNQLTYYILSDEEHKSTNWKDTPSGVFMKSFTVSGNTATALIESRAKIRTSQVYQYSDSNTYTIEKKPLPASIEGVKINATVVSEGSYTTSDKDVSNYAYNAATGIVTINYTPIDGEQINAVMISYLSNDLGEISSGATCTFAYGAEAIDDHTFVVLPKAKEKYKLTIDGIMYEDREVTDSRGVVMPRGSGGYAMWAVLKNTGWTLGICDVIAKDFDASIDYGCFNVESDMKDTLSNIQYIQQLYGGILDWDSENKILNYRAENYENYQAYKDGFNEWKGYVFREGKNMTEKPVITYDNQLITRAYLLGYGNLNIKKVNNGKSYIDDFSYTDDVYEGYLKQDLIYDTNDEGGQKQLLYWGKKELAKKCKPRRSVQLSVTDLRTVKGLEHEVFDINDVVRVYYTDEFGNGTVIEDQRITVWEYNPFAMWDCEVELGDKTLNEIDLFKLIYKKTLNSPGANNSGNISSNNIRMNGIGFGGDGTSFFGSGDSDSLTRNIQLIARTTTENTDAISGLILDTNEMHSKVDLFALYQKETDNLFTQTYAGLQLYADEKKAEAILDANNYTEQVTEEFDGTITQKIVETDAELRLYADQRGSAAELVATGYYEELKDDISQVRVESQAGFQAAQDANSALSQQFASYRTEVDGKISQSQAAVLTQVSQNYATTAMVAQVNDQVASIQIEVNGIDNKISQSVQTQFGTLGIYMSGDTMMITAPYISMTSINVKIAEIANLSVINNCRIGFSTDYLMDGNGNPMSRNIVTWQPNY